MPTKPATHKSINIWIETYQRILEITAQLAKDKGVPVSIPTAVQLLVDRWDRSEGD